MGIRDVDCTLPANRLIFEVRRDPALYQRFRGALEQVMEEYGLSSAEKDALRREDLRALARLGVHPYFLPQIARLFHGGAYNHNDSAAAQSFAKRLIAG